MKLVNTTGLPRPVHTCTCLHACMHACIRAYMYTYMRTYIHTYTHTHTHTHTHIKVAILIVHRRPAPTLIHPHPPIRPHLTRQRSRFLPPTPPTPAILGRRAAWTQCTTPNARGRRNGCSPLHDSATMTRRPATATQSTSKGYVCVRVCARVPACGRACARLLGVVRNARHCAHKRACGLDGGGRGARERERDVLPGCSWRHARTRET